MEIELYEIDGGYGFSIVQNGMIICNQPTDTTSGNEPMTKSRAQEFSQKILARLQIQIQS